MSSEILKTNYNNGYGWYYFRIFYCVVALCGLYAKYVRIPSIYCDTCPRVTSSILTLNNFYHVSISEAYLLFVGAVLSLLYILLGGRHQKGAIFFWLIIHFLILSSQGYNIKAYDRLQLFLAAILFMGPSSRRLSDLTDVLPQPRVTLLILFSYVYFSTGISKLTNASIWFNGTALGYILNHRHHGGGTLALLLSTNTPFMIFSSLFTILLEISAPFLLFSKKWNPYFLLIGVFFHLQIELLMSVGPFSYFMICAYPCLLRPDVMYAMHIRGEEIWKRFFGIVSEKV